MDFTFKADIPSTKEKELPPYSERDSVPVSDAKSIAPASVSVFSGGTDTMSADTSSFNAGTRLRIHSRGHPLVSLPVPPRELEITITDSAGNVVYTSTRAKRSSGNAILSHIKQGDLISTSYFFGPGRDPVMKMIQPFEVSLDTIRIETRWTTRATAFTLPNGRSFEWFHDSSKDSDARKGKRTNVLVLHQIDAESPKRQKRAKSSSQAIAKLIRSDATRTEGTTRCTAGNGGELVLDVDAIKYLDESIIVATCLMMLKMEIDRRRGCQFAVVMAAAS
ncbi:hypothetical protein DV736_g5871, partial [Chaetothyriales sp. CBS 134916]